MTDLGPVTPLVTPDFEAALQAQSDAADPQRSAWVEANAGSGKTRVLIDRVARLLLRRPDGRDGVDPSSILCVTYTKAAANEMLSRLFSRLGDWSIADDQTLRGELAKLESRDRDSYQDEDLDRARTLFARALETPGGLRIETIHALCARILRRFPLEAGVSPGFTEIEDAEANQLWRDVLAAHLEAAADHHPDALRVLSHATGGRGASAALDALRPAREAITRFARRIDSGDPDQLGTLVRSAANAPDATPQALLEAAMGPDLPVVELRAAAADLAALAKPGKSDAKLAEAINAVLAGGDPADTYAAYMDAIAGSKWDFPDKSNPFTAKAGAGVADLFCRDLRKGDAEGREITRMRRLRDQLSAAEVAARTNALLQIGLPMVAAYAREKRLRAALDFDDLIAFTRRLLTGTGVAQWVLYKLDGGLTHLLLDEAQDTSPAQWALINALVSEFQAGLGSERHGGPRTQFVVGDPKQSIYSFQGADEDRFRAEKELFLRREEPVAIAAGDAVNLPEMAMSFRSCPEVLAFVDTVREQVPLNDATTDDQPPADADITRHQARRQGQAGRVEVWPLEMPDPGDGDDDHWSAPVDHVPRDAPRRRLATRIAREIRAMIDRGDTVWQEGDDGRWHRRAMAPEDVLILVQRRNDLFEALIDSLKKEALPVAGADRLRLLDTIGVQDCLNLIRFALQPGDDLTLAEILRGPFCGLVDDDNELFALAHDRKGKSLWQALQAAGDPRFSQARDFVANLISSRHLPAFDFLSLHLTQRRDDGLSGWDCLVQRLGDPVREPVRALVSKALGYDMAEAASLQAFLAEIEAEASELKRELSEPNGAIRVMTVHGAKGLQAPVVILPDTTSATRKTSKQVFVTDDDVPLYAPSSSLDCPVTEALRARADAAGERESRRLLYVALTRASDRLVIAGAGLATGEGYAKSSWYRWCQLGIHVMSGEDPMQTGTPVAYGPDIVTASPQPISTRQREDGPSWLRQPAARPAPPLRLGAPSRLLDEDARVSTPFGEGRAEALRRGHLIHALLQLLPERPEAARADVATRFLARHPELSAEARQEMLETTLATLQHPDFAAIFAPGGRSEAAIVGTLPGGRMVNGRVDRLVVTETDILIVDYKTDRPAPRDLDGIGAAYTVQMAAYRAVMQQMFPAPRYTVRCALLYTDGPHLIELPGDVMSESLNRLPSGFDVP